MKILLYKPNDLMVAEEDGTHNLSPNDSVFPYSLAVVGAILREQGHQVVALDSRVQKLNLDKTIAEIKCLVPDVLVINTSPLAIDLDFQKIGDLKNKLGCKIVSLFCLGFEQEALERYPVIDVLIRREWGYALTDVIRAWEKNLPLASVKGIFYRDGEDIIATAEREHIPLADTPLPAWDLFLTKRYDHYQILMTVGCNHNCLFCHFGRYPKSGWEAKSIDRIINELKTFKSFGNKFFRIIDNELTLDKEFAKSLLQKIIEEKLAIIFDVNIRASTINDELAKLLKRAGCFSVGYGIESGVQEIMDLNFKELTLDQAKQCQRIFDKNKIYARAYFLIGLRGDTKETILETFRFIREELKAEDASFDLVIPYPDTAFYEFLKQRGLIRNFSLDNLIWIYKNVYHWPNLRAQEGIRPQWSIGALSFDDLWRINKECYDLVSHGNDRKKFYFMFLKHPLFTLRQFGRIFINPRPSISRALNIIFNQ